MHLPVRSARTFLFLCDLLEPGRQQSRLPLRHRADFRDYARDKAEVLRLLEPLPDAVSHINSDRRNTATLIREAGIRSGKSQQTV